VVLQFAKRENCPTATVGEVRRGPGLVCLCLCRVPRL
jgi:hypothetical protein